MNVGMGGGGGLMLTYIHVYALTMKVLCFFLPVKMSSFDHTNVCSPYQQQWGAAN